jgi:hypothetical protein
MPNWNDMLKQSYRDNENTLLLLGFFLAAAALLLGAMLVYQGWKHEQCIEALKQPHTEAAVALTICRE